jgi:hypothetical protein
MSPTKEKSSTLWFLGGLFAVVIAGIAKIALAEHFGPE